MSIVLMPRYLSVVKVTMTEPLLDHSRGNTCILQGRGVCVTQGMRSGLHIQVRLLSILFDELLDRPDRESPMFTVLEKRRL